MASSIDLRNVYMNQQDDEAPYRPARGIVQSVQPETETVKIESYGTYGTASVAIRHPYVGRNSWIRTMPEVGTAVLTQKVSEPSQIETWGYLSHRLAGMVRDSRTDDNIIFRELRPGEIEIMSAGRAYQHWSEDGNIMLLGGVVEQHLTQTELEARTRAPTHKRQLDQNVPTALAHEERFGLVKRPDSSKSNSLQAYVKDGTSYQYEYGRWLRDDAGNDIVTTHEGHLYDVSQKAIKNGQTSKPVRFRKMIAHRQTGDITLDIDEELNIIMANSSQAKTTDLDFGAQNAVKITSKKLDLNATQSSNQIFGTSLTMRSPRMSFNSSIVGFGSAPSQPAVLGTALVSSILTPFISLVQSSFSVLLADAALSDTPTKKALKSLVDSMTSISASVSTILSTEVTFTK